MHRRSRKVIECHGKSKKVKEGHGRSFPSTRLTLKSYVWAGGRWVVACRIIMSDPVTVPFLWTLDLRLWTWA